MSTYSEIVSAGNGNYDLAKKLRRTMSNPWLAEEIDRIPGDGFWRSEFCMVVASYAHTKANPHLHPWRCACGSEVHFKNTIGSFKCVGCGSLFDSNRGPYGKPPSVEFEESGMWTGDPEGDILLAELRGNGIPV